MAYSRPDGVNPAESVEEGQVSRRGEIGVFMVARHARVNVRQGQGERAFEAIELDGQEAATTDQDDARRCLEQRLVLVQRVGRLADEDATRPVDQVA